MANGTISFGEIIGGVTPTIFSASLCNTLPSTYFTADAVQYFVWGCYPLVPVTVTLQQYSSLTGFGYMEGNATFSFTSVAPVETIILLLITAVVNGVGYIVGSLTCDASSWSVSAGIDVLVPFAFGGSNAGGS